MSSILDVSGKAMTAHKEWMGTIANNLANINTTRTEEGGPYRRQTVAFQAIDKFNTVYKGEIGAGVIVDQVVQDNNVDLRYEPNHPDANADGYVAYPAINMTSEINDLLVAQRGYEANSTVLTASKEVMAKTQEIGRV